MAPIYDISKKATERDSKKMSGCQNLGRRGEGWTGRAQGIFKEVKWFCTIPDLWIHDIMPLSKPIILYDMKSNPNINYGL